MAVSGIFPCQNIFFVFEATASRMLDLSEEEGTKPGLLSERIILEEAKRLLWLRLLSMLTGSWLFLLAEPQVSHAHGNTALQFPNNHLWRITNAVRVLCALEL